MKKPVITVRMWTERFLGIGKKADEFLSMVKTLDAGKWMPDKWSQFEPIKNDLTPDSEQKIILDWTEQRQGRTSNTMLFKKRKPYLRMAVTSWRGHVPDLNFVWFDMQASEFGGNEGVVRLKKIVADFVSWSGAVYAMAQHSGQHHFRSAPGSPTKRLDQLNWLTFLGAPYLDLFGEKHIRECPFYSCEAVADGLLLTAAERPDSPSISSSDDLLRNLEKCLDTEVLATDNYPEVPCRVPDFDLRETVNFD